MGINWLLRAVQWVRNPPSPTMVKFVLAIFVVALGLYAIERYLGWPDFLTVEPLRRGLGGF